MNLSSKVSIIVVLLLGLWLGWPQPVLNIERDIYPLAHEFMGLMSVSSEPLKGLTVVLTGATSGIGKSLTRTLAGMGATVVVVGRSEHKLEKLGEEVNGTIPIVANLNDLSSVAKAAEEISNQFDKVDVLINNAGMHYYAHPAVDDHPVSVQNYDLSFAVNYLSHFLLTEKLFPKLENSNKATIVQISSSYHWAVNGADLMASESKPPAASVPGAFSGLWQDQRAYANSKLAQLLHSRALVRHGVSNVRVVNICPGWVGTDIAGGKGGIAHFTLDTLAFPVDGWGIASALHALMAKGEEDYFTNAKSFRYITSLFPQILFEQWAADMRVRDMIGKGMTVFFLFLQKFFAAAEPDRSSPESYDLALQDSLYQWSKEAVAEWM